MSGLACIVIQFLTSNENKRTIPNQGFLLVSLKTNPLIMNQKSNISFSPTSTCLTFTLCWDENNCLLHSFWSLSLHSPLSYIPLFSFSAHLDLINFPTVAKTDQMSKRKGDRRQIRIRSSRYFDVVERS